MPRARSTARQPSQAICRGGATWTLTDFNLGAVVGGRGWRFAQAGVPCYFRLVSRLAAYSAIVAASGRRAWLGSTGWGRSAGVRRSAHLTDEVLCHPWTGAPI